MSKKIILILFMLGVFFFGLSIETQAAQGDIILKKSGRGKITFRLNNADIKTVLQIFSRQLGLNIVAGDNITGTVSMAFTNVDPMEGLDAILRVKGYSWVREGDTLMITTDMAVKTYTLQFANAEEVKDSILPLLASTSTGTGSAGSKSGTISVNKSYNQIIVSASSDKIASIDRAIAKVDVPQTQVVVEAHIVEIKRSDDGTLGVGLKGQMPSDANKYTQTVGFTNSKTTTGLYAQVISSNYEGYLSAVLEAKNYSIIASPRITTINHKEATILIGEKLGYQTTTTTTTGTSTTIKFLETGTKLVITPHVSSNGYIRMNIAPKISEGTVDKTTGVPNENTTETKSEVLVKDGQTIVIGGLIKKKELQTETGIPILMHIPFIGMAFKKTVISNEDRELIVFIRPRIITPEYLETMQSDVKKFIKKQESQGSSLIH